MNKLKLFLFLLGVLFLVSFVSSEQVCQFSFPDHAFWDQFPNLAEGFKAISNSNTSIRWYGSASSNEGYSVGETTFVFAWNYYSGPNAYQLYQYDGGSARYGKFVRSGNTFNGEMTWNGANLESCISAYGDEEYCEGGYGWFDSSYSVSVKCFDSKNCTDSDKDGYFAVSPNCSAGDDCNDKNVSINPGAEEICGNDIDENCDGNLTCLPDCIDKDGDRYNDSMSDGSAYNEIQCGPLDCNGSNPSFAKFVYGMGSLAQGEESERSTCCSATIDLDTILRYHGYPTCNTCENPNVLVYEIGLYDMGASSETSICCPAGTDTSKILRSNWKPNENCTTCENPKVIVYSADIYDQGDDFKSSICCPAGTNPEEVLMRRGLPNEDCKTCKSPNVTVYGLYDKGQGKSFETSTCCPAGTNPEEVLRWFGNPECTTCSSPNVLVYGLLTKGKGKSEESSICCPAGTNPEEVLRWSGKPDQDCKTCENPNVLVYGLLTKGKGKSEESSICCPAGTDASTILSIYGDLNKNCKTCENPNVLVYGLLTKGKGKSEESSICCPAGTNPEEVLIWRGIPHENCTTCSSPNVVVYGSGNNRQGKESESSICCPAGFNFFQEKFDTFSVNSVPVKCGKCKLYDLFACEGDCSHCSEDNKVMKLDSLTADEKGNCKEQLFEDCNEKGNDFVCVEHVKNSLGDIAAQCESCPDSMTFITKRNDHMQETSDGFEELEKGSGWVSENTYFSFQTIDDVFKKIEQRCNKCPTKDLTVIVRNHGSPGSQGFTDKTNEINLEENDLNVNSAKDLKKYNLGCLKNLILGGCSVGGCNGGKEGEIFLNELSDSTGAYVEAATKNVFIDANGEESILDGGYRVTIGEDRTLKRVEPHTIFYLTDKDAAYPGFISDQIYQTEVYEGNLGYVDISIGGLDGPDSLAMVEELDMPCSYEVVESVDLEVSSEEKEIVFKNFKIDLLPGAISENESVKIKINKLKVDCSVFEYQNPVTPYVDSKSYNDALDSYQRNVIDSELFGRFKSAYENNWQCEIADDCYGPCTVGMPNCQYDCVDHKCVAENYTSGICNGIDDNKDGFIDEYCDIDMDGFVNPDMTCEGGFVSANNKISVPFKKEDLVLNLNENSWNLVVVPINGTINASYLRDRFEKNNSQRCIVTENFLTWDTEKQDYVSTKEITNGKAYWIYSLNNCFLPLYQDFGAKTFEAELNYGWNFVPFVKDFSNVYSKNTDFYFYDSIQGQTKDTKKLSSLSGMGINWDSNKLYPCSPADLDDFNSTIGGTK